MIQSRLNLLVVICHDLGQYLGCYGVADARTPNIDRFAAENTRFENSFCTSPGCSPARAALWTGRYPHTNGVVGLCHAGFANDLNAGEVHLAEMLKNAGYESRLVGVQHESPDWQRCGYESRAPVASCGELAENFAKFLCDREGDERPWFAQVGLFEPHRPFPHDDVESKSPESFALPGYLPDIPEVREDLADLEALVASVDLAFGKILEALEKSGEKENTLILFTADHGIPFSHAKMTLYEPGIEVPLILGGPGIPREKVFLERVSHIDVLPTLLEMLDVEAPNPLQGRSFRALLGGREYEENKYIFAEKTYHTYFDPMRSVSDGRWKLIANFEHAPYQETSPDYFNNAKSYVEVSKALNKSGPEGYHPPFELFELEADPDELENLAEDVNHAETRDRLHQVLLRWMEDTEDPLLGGPIASGGFWKRLDAFKNPEKSD